MTKILVIDDDAGVRSVLNLMLSCENYVVIEAKDGREGVRRFSTEHPDLVICDIVMPDQDGIQTICEMRESAPAIPIIAISGGGIDIGPSYLGLARKLGAASILSKPFRAAELVALVDRLLVRPN